MSCPGFVCDVAVSGFGGESTRDWITSDSGPVLWLTLEIVRMTYRCRRLWLWIANGWVAGSNLMIGLMGGKTGGCQW